MKQLSEIELTEGQLLSQEFGVGGPPAEKARPLAVIEAELDLLEKDTRQKETALIENYIEVGRRLTEAKAQLPHGEWGRWLEKRGYPQPKAAKLMKVFRAYGQEQQSLFGSEAKSKALANLGFQKLVQLLAIEDEDEREQFVVENDVQNMSTRELEKALKARDEAEEKAAAAQDEADRLEKRVLHLQEEIAGQAQVYEAKLTSAGVEADQARAAAKAALEALDKQRDKAQRLRDALSEANTSAQAAEEEHARLAQELEELRSRPAETDTAAVEAARQTAIAEMKEKVDKAKDAKKKAEEKRKAAEESLEAAQKELAELRAKGPEVRELTQEEKEALTADAVEKARIEDLERVRVLEKQLASADGDVAAFRVHYEAWQDHYNKMSGYLAKVAGREPERADKLRMAVKAVIERMAAG